MTTRVAINGFGRIGEMFLRTVLADDQDIEVVAINDIVPLDQIEYLMRFDSVHPGPPVEIASGPGWMRVDDHEVRVFRERDPATLPWADLGVDIAVECTGVFRDRDGLGKHLAAGAKKVVLSAPAKAGGADVTLCMGVNDDTYDPAAHTLVSNASCTTNCLAPVVRCIDEAFGLEWGLVSAVHAYTGSQALIDAANRKRRRGRAAAINIVPTTTGAAKAVGLVLPHLDGRIKGMAFRVPVPDGSIIDFTFQTRAPFTTESLNAAFATAASEPSYEGVLTITDDELVSSDIVGAPYSAIVEARSTIQVNDRTAKVLAWYDNEWGYACRLRDVVALVGRGMGRSTAGADDAGATP